MKNIIFIFKSPSVNVHSLIFSNLRYLLPTLIFALLRFSSFAQNIPVNFKFCTGTGELCVTPSDSTYELCLTFQPGFCDSKEYDILWDDGSTEKITLDKEKTVSHVYDLRDFIKNCSSTERVYNFNIGSSVCDNDNRGYLLKFKKKPEAKPFIESACAGTLVNIRNNSCPIQGTTFLWEFSDGQRSTDIYPALSFTDPNATYKVKLTATSKTCGAGTAEAEFKLGKLPVPAFSVKGTTVLGKDTVVCSSGGGVLELDGSVSEEESEYSWQVTGGKYTYQSNTNTTTAVIKIKLEDAEEYTISLTVRNKCGSKRITRKYRLVSLPHASLTPQPDVCEEISYKLSGSTPGAVYTLNGNAITPGQEIPLKYANAPYIVIATLVNACGNQTVSDTFTVSPAQPVRITSLPKDTVMCVGTNAIALVADIAGGQWTGNGIETENNRRIFVPRTAGTYTIAYTRGTGKCVMTDAVKITVEGVKATAEDKTVCEGTGFARLTGVPAGGTWATSSCTNCISGDTLFTNGFSGSEILVTYSVVNATGCKAQAAAKVLFGKPKADFSISGGCSGASFKPVNNSSGAESYTWLVNGKQVSNTENPELRLSPGTQKITLVANAGSCSDTIQKEIAITTPPAAVSFVPSVESGCSPLKVVFEVNGKAGQEVEYVWTVDNAVVYTGFQLPAQTLENSGKGNKTFRISLAAKNACGEQIDHKLIIVRPLARAEIGVDSTTLRCTPASLLFSNRSSGHTRDLSRWLFGDGTVLQTGSDTVSHLFSAKDSSQTFLVRLEVTSECGTDAAAVPITVFPTTVKALYTMSKSEVCPGELVSFKDATVPKPTRWLWKFGDGSVSTLANPIHIFAKATSDYKVTLIAYTPCGFDSTQLTIRTTELPKGSFETETLACVKAPVSIRNQSDSQFGFIWDFGDGSPLDSSHFSPEHTYAQAGSYTLTLSVYQGTQACKVRAKALPITVVSAARASFGFEGDSLFCAPGPVSILNLSEPADSYQWYFSDGRTSDVKNPTLAFEPGQYSVKLITVKGGVCLDSTERAAAFVVKPCQVDIPEAFTPNADGIGDRYTLFGNGIQEISLLRIRNRWGEMVFEMKNVKPGSQLNGESWDGSFGNKPMPADMYVYEAEVIYIDQRKSAKLKGNIYLAR